jgi:hypothetical protein
MAPNKVTRACEAAVKVLLGFANSADLNDEAIVTGPFVGIACGDYS